MPQQLMDAGVATIDANAATIDECREILKPLGLALTHEEIDDHRWHLMRLRVDRKTAIIGQGSTLLGAYRQAAHRLQLFGLKGLLASL